MSIDRALRLDSTAPVSEIDGFSEQSEGRRGREAEGGGLLNRYTGLYLYRGFESPRLRRAGLPVIIR